MASYFPSRLCGFAVPGFIFLSAMKLSIRYKEEKIAPKKYYTSRFKKIFLPYVTAVIVYYMFFIFAGYLKFDLAYLVSNIFTGRLVSHFYFVIVITFFYILAPLWLNMTKKSSEFIMLPLSLFIMILATYIIPERIYASGVVEINRDILFVPYIFYWVCGCYAGENYERFKQLIKTNRWLILCGYVISAAMLVYLDYMRVKHANAYGYLEMVRMMYCFFSILAAFCGAIWLAAKENLKAVYIFDSKTYMIYLYHCLVIFLADYALTYIKIMRIGPRLVLRFFIVYGICITYGLLFGKKIKK